MTAMEGKGAHEKASVDELELEREDFRVMEDARRNRLILVNNWKRNQTYFYP